MATGLGEAKARQVYLVLRDRILTGVFASGARLPNGDAQLMPDSGHSPYFEQAATFNRLVEAFLSLHR